MGFINDVTRLMQKSKELDKTFDPGAQTRSAVDAMREMNRSMEQSTQAIVDGVPGTAQILTVGMSAVAMNMNPVLPVELLVTQEGGMPRPVSMQLIVPIAHLSRVVPGGILPVMCSPTDPNAVAVMWDAPST